MSYLKDVLTRLPKMTNHQTHEVIPSAWAKAHLGDHIRQNVIGAVCMQSAWLFRLIVDDMDTEVFQLYLDELARAIPEAEGKWQLFIMDNASRHKSA